MEIIEKTWSQDEILNNLAKAKMKREILITLNKNTDAIDNQISDWENRLE